MTQITTLEQAMDLIQKQNEIIVEMNKLTAQLVKKESIILKGIKVIGVVAATVVAVGAGVMIGNHLRDGGLELPSMDI